ncbi:MAG: hypothetical protein IGR76_12850 [Synechococcales cyanobacterium T60_A2020_003]|nr:hypothetical protein [Synechococcales cyanobacterium T60_A2020_003]
MQLLCLSNGHGEDAIALRIVQALRSHPAAPDIAALPMVGTGQAYIHHNVPIVGPTKQMPSGGFVYMDQRQLWRDVKGGLLGLTIAQFQTVKAWANAGGLILAVGDIVPLLFAWASGAPYAFVGTAKSEYYLQDEAGWLPRRSWFEQMESWSGSVYLPWERWLMSRKRCKAVFPRDTLTCQILKRWSIPVFDLGNPMMDGLEPSGTIFEPYEAAADVPPLTIALLPGSRSPEAEANWDLILKAIQDIVLTFRQRPLLFLGAIAPNLDLAPFRSQLQSAGWLPRTATDAAEPLFTQRHASLILTQTGFADCLHQADFAIALAGTATEQFVGLGKPAITIAGRGPQFTPAFAEAQTRLLGSSVCLVNEPSQVVTVLGNLLQNPDALQVMAENGHRRMGVPGAAHRIADALMQHLS